MSYAYSISREYRAFRICLGHYLMSRIQQCDTRDTKASRHEASEHILGIIGLWTAFETCTNIYSLLHSQYSGALVTQSSCITLHLAFARFHLRSLSCLSSLLCLPTHIDSARLRSRVFPSSIDSRHQDLILPKKTMSQILAVVETLS